MSRQIALTTLILAFCVALCPGDTFTHRQSGEVFHGFLTQKQSRGKTLVYIEKDKGFKPLSLAEYDVIRDDKGRRNSVVIVPVTYEEAIVSRSVAETIAKMIVEASNKGLSGGPYGGAYSAAVTLALACEKIYIAGDAVIGSVAPVVGRSPAAENVVEFYELFSSDSLAAYSSYVATLAANRQRPAALAAAMLDKSMEIIEVEDPDGNRRFINKADRSPQEAVIRTVSKTESQRGWPTRWSPRVARCWKISVPEMPA